MKVLHTADWHFREKDHDEIFKCVSFILGRARIEKPDLICISGDMTDSRLLSLDSNSARSIFSIVQAMLDIAPVAIVIGTPSHDGNAALALRECRGEYPILVSDMPEQYGYVSSAKVFLDMHRLSGPPDFIVTQIPQPTKQYFVNTLSVEDSERAIGDVMGNMLAGYGINSKLHDDIPHILNSHGQIGGAYISETQQLIGHDIEVSKDQLKAVNADLVCYGHIHKAQDMGDGIFYAGSPTRMNYGETEDKGFYIHDVSEGIQLSEFVKTPAVNLLEIKEDFTGVKFDIGDLDTVLNKYAPEELVDSRMKITLTMWQDDALSVNQTEIKQSFLDAGCSAVKFSLVRKPRESVRAERVLEAESLPDKLQAMAELRGEEIAPGVIEKARAVEAGNDEAWKKRETTKTKADMDSNCISACYPLKGKI